MKICNSKEQLEKTGIQDESLCYTICDLLRNLKGNYQWMMVLFCILLTSCIVFIPNLSICLFKKLTELYLSVFSSTLGLSIAAYTIVIGFQSDTLKKLLKTDTKNIKPFHVICASMIFNGILQTFSIIFAFAYQLCELSFIFYISTFLGCYSILQILDILLQLLGLRTFVANIDNYDKRIQI